MLQPRSAAAVQERASTWAPTGPLAAMGACTQRTRAVVMRPFGRCRKLASSKVSVSLSGAYEASCTSDMRSVFVPGTATAAPSAAPRRRIPCAAPPSTAPITVFQRVRDVKLCSCTAAALCMEERSGTLKLAAAGKDPSQPSARPAVTQQEPGPTSRVVLAQAGTTQPPCWHTVACQLCRIYAGFPHLQGSTRRGQQSKRRARARTAQPPEPPRPARGLPVRYGPPAAAYVCLNLCLPLPNLHLAALVHQPVEQRQRPWLRHHAPDALRRPCTAERQEGTTACSPGDWPPQPWRRAKQELFTVIRVPAPSRKMPSLLITAWRPRRARD